MYEVCRDCPKYSPICTCQGNYCKRFRDWFPPEWRQIRRMFGALPDPPVPESEISRLNWRGRE